ncbi:unnamed protein product [Rhizophagus irregularis]|nr:unnamed protein product [Rhizophagus irregularis]
MLEQSERTYPPSPKFTQKPRNNAPQYPIPNNYIYAIQLVWKEGRAEWSVNSTKSSTAVANTFLQKIGQKHSTKLSGPRLFGLDIEPLYNFRYKLESLPITTTCNKNSNSTTTQTRLDSIVRVCDEAFLGNFNIDKEINNQSSIDDDVNEYTGDILVDDHEVGNGAFRSLLTLLKALYLFGKQEKSCNNFQKYSLY